MAITNQCSYCHACCDRNVCDDCAAVATEARARGCELSANDIAVEAIRRRTNRLSLRNAATMTKLSTLQGLSQMVAPILRQGCHVSAYRSAYR